MKTLSSALLCLCALSACSNTDCTPTGGVEDRAVSSIDCAPQELCYRGSCRDSCNAAGASCEADSDCPGVRPNCVDSPTGKVCSSCEHGQYCVGSLHICVDFSASAPDAGSQAGVGTIPAGTEPSDGGSTAYADASITPIGPDDYPATALGIETIAQVNVQVTPGEPRQLSRQAYTAGSVQTATTGWAIDPDGSLWQVDSAPILGNPACVVLERTAVASATPLEVNAPELVLFSNQSTNSTPVAADTLLQCSDASTTYSLSLQGDFGEHGGSWSTQRAIPGWPSYTHKTEGGRSTFTWRVTAALPNQYVQLLLSVNGSTIVCTSLADSETSGSFGFPLSQAPSGTAQLHSFNQARVTGTERALFLLLRIRASTPVHEF